VSSSIQIGLTVGRATEHESPEWARGSHRSRTIPSMPPLPRVTGRQVVQALGRLGWVIVVQRGSHAQLKHATRGGRVTVPLHPGEIIGPGLLRAILAQAGVTAEEFRAAL
jgi:predicted RNA binding protein YcfA (HicA-like mRNA interferase family)